MIINIRKDGSQFDPAEIRITEETMPILYKQIRKIIERNQEERTDD